MSNAIIVNERRRSWPEDLKRRILREAEEPGESICSVARRYELDSGQLYQWRKKFREAELASTKLMPVEVVAEHCYSPKPSPEAISAPQVENPKVMHVEIACKSGHTVFAPIDIDPNLLVQFIAALEAV